MSDRILHPIPPTWNGESEILILGSFPSVKSREMAYFYGHPQNRFWKVLSVLFEEDIPGTAEGRRAFLLRHRIAAWDVIAACRITGSADSSIRDVEANDLRPILEGAPIRQIFTNGKTADRLYRQHTLPVTGIPAVCLPSTSPANAAWSLDRLAEAWAVIRKESGEGKHGI